MISKSTYNRLHFDSINTWESLEHKLKIWFMKSEELHILRKS